MIELLRAAAQDDPAHVALESGSGTYTHADLVARAESAAAFLVEREITALAVLDTDAAVVWPLLAAGSLGRVEICVLPPAATPETIEALRAKLGLDVVATTRDLPGALDPQQLFDHPHRLQDAPATPRELLVLTTGTSGLPKAARHDWDRILRSTARIVPTPEHRWLLAYGMNQFGGLQILLHASASRATLVAPGSFQPRDALAAMRRHGVTHASGSPTLWRFVLAEIRSDGGPVPQLQQLTLSGEAVPAPLLGQLRSTFPHARFSQIYAATEFGQGITVRDGEAGLPASFLDGDGDLQMRIVDGELQVRSAAAMLGYAGGEDTAPPPEWRPTGDVVELVGDRILFRGRTSEVVNVGGVKINPLIVEDAVGGLPGITLVHAYGRPNAMVGHVIALDVVADAGADQAQLREAVRQACEPLPPAARPRIIKFVESIETGGSKIVRRGVQ